MCPCFKQMTVLQLCAAGSVTAILLLSRVNQVTVTADDTQAYVIYLIANQSQTT